MLYIKTYDGIGWFVTGETGAVERPGRFMSVEEAVGWCVQHRPAPRSPLSGTTAPRSPRTRSLPSAMTVREFKKTR